jgi:hypothetical protein
MGTKMVQNVNGIDIHRLFMNLRYRLSIGYINMDNKIANIKGIMIGFDIIESQPNPTIIISKEASL